MFKQYINTNQNRISPTKSEMQYKIIYNAIISYNAVFPPNASNTFGKAENMKKYRSQSTYSIRRTQACYHINIALAISLGKDLHQTFNFLCLSGHTEVLLKFP